MKIIIKTLNGKTFDIEAEETDTVLATKETIASVHDNMPAESQKLIALGKIMDNDKTLKDYNVSEGNFLVVMVTKAKPKKKKEEEKKDEPMPAQEPAQP